MKFREWVILTCQVISEMIVEHPSKQYQDTLVSRECEYL